MDRKDNGSALTSMSFLSLNATQFLGALNDNVFKLLMTFCLIPAGDPAGASRVMATAGAVFVVPFLLFTAGAGVLADRWSKRTILVLAKWLEIVIMGLGVAAFASGQAVALYGVLFLMSAQSALFGPAKYGIVPELVRRDRLSQANSVLVMLTYLAIILGSGLAPLLSEATHARYVVAQWVCVGIAVAGTIASHGIRKTPPAGSREAASVFFVGDVWRTLRSIRHDRFLVLAVLASAYFTLLGAFLQLNLIPYGMAHLHLTQERSGYLFFIAALGIAAGAAMAGRASGRNIEFGIVPVGSLLLTAATIGLHLVPETVGPVCVVIFVAGLGAGLFVVPLDAFIQYRSPPEQVGRVVAASGFLSWTGVLVASGLLVLSSLLGLEPGQAFVFMGLLTLVLTVATFRVLPDFLLRFLGLLITRSCYRIRTVGIENLPTDGGALLVCNHVSWVDALLLNAAQQRRIRFVVDRDIYQVRWLTPLFRLMGVIPVSRKDSPKRLVASLQQVRAVLDEGYMACIFAEGTVTRTGMPMEFKSGFEHVVKGSAHPVIPVYIGGAWGSIFSYYHGTPASRWPVLWRYPVTLVVGRPLPPTATSGEVREAVLELSCRYYEEQKPRRRSLGEHFVKMARERWGRPAVSDTGGRRLTFGELLASALVLARDIERGGVGQEKIGVLLPPSVAGVTANVAAVLAGQVPVNLNYTASDEAVRSAVTRCGIRRVLSSRAFLEKLGRFRDLPGVEYLEDVVAHVPAGARFRAWVAARFLPRRAVVRGHGPWADRLATVIFSSGSTGVPKGVLLSHHNILSNVESMRSIFRFSPEDSLCAALPFFHSFGFTCSLWLPLLSGFPAHYHANPLDGQRIAELVRGERATFLFATPTFLLAYLRRAKPEDFLSLRFVVVGAEKLQSRLAEAFREQFGIQPLEGYGATELAPVATLSLPDVEAGGVRQTGLKIGSVGHPLPGVAVKVVDPATRARLPAGTPGLLLIKGPNVMMGYLDDPAGTAAAIRDGWYDTGDIGVVDRDGFVTITDRLSRFSKIGGEMVPHVAVEEMLHRGLGTTEQVLAVTGVPDEKRGEALVVLYTPEAGDPPRLAQMVKESELPNLWKPAPDAYIPIPALPLLGSGKLDLHALRETAARLARRT